MNQLKLGNILFTTPGIFEPYQYLNGKQFDLCIVGKDCFLSTVFFERCKNIIIFDANRFHTLRQCEKFIILENGLLLRYLYTSFKGVPEKINIHKVNDCSLYDMLFLRFTKKKDKVLCIGSAFAGAFAGWKNDRICEVVEYDKFDYDKAINDFQNATQQQKLMF